MTDPNLFLSELFIKLGILQLISPASTFISVDFPAPLRPTRHTLSFSCKAKSA
ncbi:Uncharacterised protein [Vibrio cholerae]|nr:Uncharacterised protein [Vibrio cholerae]